MIDTATVKSYFKEASDSEAMTMYTWIVAALEIRGLIAIEIPNGRKRRSDAGVRKLGLPSSEASLSGFPDENRAGE